VSAVVLALTVNVNKVRCPVKTLNREETDIVDKEHEQLDSAAAETKPSKRAEESASKQPKSPDALDTIEKRAVEQAESSQDPDFTAKALDIAKTVSEMRKLRSETEKITLDANEASREHKAAATRYYMTILTTTSAVALAAATLGFQIWQQRSNTELQTDTQKLQIDANEDSQWRDTVKTLNSPGTTLVSAFEMGSFFYSKHHSMQARNIAATLLPTLDNPDAFDTVLFDMLDYDDASNGRHIIAISRTVFNSQLDLYGINVGMKQPLRLDFPTLKKILGDDEPPNFISQDVASRKRASVAPWMLDSVSAALLDLWLTKKATPGKDLGGIVLENGNFNGLDFSHIDLKGGAFYNATFTGANFAGTDFTRRLISHANVAGADLSGVVDFSESKWELTNWWDAKCLSEVLLHYLENNDATASSENKAKAHAISCH